MENELKRNRHVQINVTNNLHVSCDADLNKETGKVQPYIILEGAPDEEASNKDIVKYRMFIPFTNWRSCPRKRKFVCN
jgi:hypothetical protein